MSDHAAMRRYAAGLAREEREYRDEKARALRHVEEALAKVEGLKPREVEGAVNMLRDPRPIDPGMLEVVAHAAGALVLAGWSLDEITEMLLSLTHP